jgi:TonB family protein
MRKNQCLLFCLLVSGLLLNAAGVNAQLLVYEDEVATPPELSGGKQALNKFIQSHLVYPEDAIVNRIEGRVIVGFTITEEGKVVDVQIQKSLFPACDSTVIQLIQSLPDWKPAKQIDKKPMLCHVSLPISFDLSAYRKLNGKDCECIDAIKQTTDIIYNAKSVDTPPGFPGGENALRQYMFQNISVPESEKREMTQKVTNQRQAISNTKRVVPSNQNITINSVDGRVELLFIVSPTGKISCVELVKSLKKSFDDVVINAIKYMPAWTPGIHNGEAVYTYFLWSSGFRVSSTFDTR